MNDLTNQLNMMGLAGNQVVSLIDAQKTVDFVCYKCGTRSIDESVLFLEGCTCMVCISYNPVRSRICSKCFLQKQ